MRLQPLDLEPTSAEVLELVVTLSEISLRFWPFPVREAFDPRRELRIFRRGQQAVPVVANVILVLYLHSTVNGLRVEIGELRLPRGLPGPPLRCLPNITSRPSSAVHNASRAPGRPRRPSLESGNFSTKFRVRYENRKKTLTRH